MNQFRTLMAAFEQYRAKHHKLINSYTDKDRHSLSCNFQAGQGVRAHRPCQSVRLYQSRTWPLAAGWYMDTIEW